MTAATPNETVVESSPAETAPATPTPAEEDTTADAVTTTTVTTPKETDTAACADQNNGAETDATTESITEEKAQEDANNKAAVVSSSKRSRPAYKYDPEKITLRFLFANRDGLTVTIDCAPGDTVGEVKGALMSVWPDDFPNCTGGEYLRLVCMGKGFLMPDTRTLEDCQIPVFKTHPTPVNVSVKPALKHVEDTKKKKMDHGSASNSARVPMSANAGAQADQGCACIIL